VDDVFEDQKARSDQVQQERVCRPEPSTGTVQQKPDRNALFRLRISDRWPECIKAKARTATFEYIVVGSGAGGGTVAAPWA
jgi:hypothetical protein